MNAAKNGLSTRRLLVGGIVILALLCNTGFCLTIFGRWWLWLPGSPTPKFTFVTVTPGPTVNLVILPDATSCGASPVGWDLYTIQPGDTLSELAARFQVSQERIMRANCLTSPDLLAEQLLYLPPLATPTPCPPSPTGWSPYLVQRGDTLSQLATARDITVEAAIQANCLESSDIAAGQRLYLPILPTPTPCLITPPAGWELYTVRSNDTIFSLATAQGTTSAEVMRVNCLQSDAIVVGQELFLPVRSTSTPISLPTVTSIALSTIAPTVEASTAEPPTIEPPTIEPSTIEPPTIEPPTIEPPTTEPPTIEPPTIEPPTTEPLPFTPTPIPVGLITSGDPGGDVPGVEELNDEPCAEDTQGEPKLYSFNSTAELGQRIYFFACNFTNAISATVTRSDGITESVEIHGPTSSTLPPYIANKITGTVTAAIEWSALPTLPVTNTQIPETYMLTAIDNSNNALRPVSTVFFVEPPRKPHILVVPQAGPLYRTNFIVYYVNFPPSLTLTFDLFSQGQMGRAEKTSELYYRHSKQVPINQTLSIDEGVSGWAVMPLDLGPAPVNLAYAISYREENLADRQPGWLFWLY